MLARRTGVLVLLRTYALLYNKTDHLQVLNRQASKDKPNQTCMSVCLFLSLCLNQTKSFDFFRVSKIVTTKNQTQEEKEEKTQWKRMYGLATAIVE